MEDSTEKEKLCEHTSALIFKAVVAGVAPGVVDRLKDAYKNLDTRRMKNNGKLVETYLAAVGCPLAGR